MKPTFTLGFLLLAILLLAPATPSLATRPEPDPDPDLLTKATPTSKAGGSGTDNSWLGGFGIPGFDNGWENIGGGPGARFGGPSIWHPKGGVRLSVVCKDKGPCYNKKLTCPEKCFTSYSRSGKGFGAGGGGGGCIIDCKKKCTAHC